MVRSLLSRLFGGGSSTDRDDRTASDESREDPDADAANEDGKAAEEETNDVWDLIPSWEYDGKYVQSGGHTRGEQEKALQDIQRQAAEIERSEDDPRPDQ